MGMRNAISIRLFAIGLGGGLLFALMDALINANPIAQRLYTVFRPVARESVNAPLGLMFDLLSGMVMALVFVWLMPILPSGYVQKGIAFGLLAWFFRVAMGAASQFVMFRVPAAALLYGVFTGMAEMIALGLFYAVLLKPR